jgi:DNA polymerase-3 subunit beta
MQFTIQREELLQPLQAVVGVVEKRQTLPILGNLLLELEGERLTLTGTDLEVELVSSVLVHGTVDPGRMTVSARKLMDLTRSLPEQAMMHFSRHGDDRLRVVAGSSRITLGTLPADEFPNVDAIEDAATLTLPQARLLHLIDQTHFAMAQQDVRYFLMGLYLQSEGETLRAVSTDGHRLALCELQMEAEAEQGFGVILPRKGVMELRRLLETEGDAPATLRVGSNHLQVELGGVRFTSKLVDGEYPNYKRVIPPAGENQAVIDRQSLRDALLRASILSTEKFRGVRLVFEPGMLKVMAHNPEREQSEEEVPIDYDGDEIAIGFNVSYLLDVLNANADKDSIRIAMKDGEGSCLVTPEEMPEAENCLFVVMPILL